MSIASLVFTQSLHEISPAKRMVLQRFQTPHKCFYSYLSDSQQSFQKIPKDQPHSPCPQASSGCPTGKKKTKKPHQPYFLWGSEWVFLVYIVPFCQSQVAELPGEGTARCLHPTPVQE